MRFSVQPPISQALPSFSRRCSCLLGLLGATVLCPGAAGGQSPAELSGGVMYERIQGANVYGVAALGDGWSIGSLGIMRLSLGGRAFLGRGDQPGSQAGARTHWGIGPAVFLSWGAPDSRQRLRAFGVIGYSTYRVEGVTEDEFNRDRSVRNRNGGSLSSQSGVEFDHGLGPGWGVSAAIVVHNQPIGEGSRYSGQLVLGIYLR